MRPRAIAIPILCLLVVSMLASTGNNANAVGYVDSKTVQKILLKDRPVPLQENQGGAKKVEVDLDESLSVSTDRIQGADQNNTVQGSRPTVHQQIDLTEKLPISVNRSNPDAIVLIKQNSENIAALDKIAGIERLRFDGKKFVEGNSESRAVDLQHQWISLWRQSVTAIAGDSRALENELGAAAHLAADPKNPVLLVLLVPVSAYVLVRSEGVEITFYRSRKLASVAMLAVIILATAAGPISVSPNFVAYAYSQESSGNQGLENPANGTSNSTQPIKFNGYSNSTQPIKFNGYSNSTQPIKFNGYSNSTQPIKFNGYSNSTQQTVLPNATQSLDFGAKDNGTKSVGDVGLENDTSGTTLQLQGDGYLTANGSATRDIKDLTLSAWVKPDYSQGSPVFTVLSKETEFALTINNLISPARTAQFSVFDGIRWNTVNSTEPLGEDWTHLAATFNGSSIALYVNGTLQSSARLTNMITITEMGNLATKNSTDLSSNADIVVGAEYSSVRKEASSQFSGQISKVGLYDSLLTPSQIQELYSQNIGSFYPGMLQAANHNSTLADSLGLLDAISLNYTGSNMTNSTTANSTLTNSSLSLNPVKAGFGMGDSPELHFKFPSGGGPAKHVMALFARKEGPQSGQWLGSSEDIKIRLLSPHGKDVSAGAVFTKMADGKFDIKIPASRYGRPGMYTAIVELTKGGKSYETTTTFEWGLVIVNTDKSIYRPGDTADLTLVVLDSSGSPVCNSQISMDITSPGMASTILATGSGITRDPKCGLYEAQYQTSTEGNYTVDVSASTPEGMVHFDSYFLAKNRYDFDIIRTADSKIDPVNNPNHFNVRIDIGSYVKAQGLTIKEFVPSVFNVTTDASVQTVGDTKVLTWNRDLVDNKTSVGYSYSVPLDFPQVYALGPVQILYGSGQNFTEARQWFVANDPAGTINLDVSKGTQISTAANSISGSITVGNNNYRVLAVGLAVNSKTAGEVSTVKDGALSFTKIDALVTASQGGPGGSKPIDDEMWYLVNPPTGSNTVTATLSGSNTAVMSMGITSLYGVSNSTTLGATATNYNPSANNVASISVVTTKTNSWVVDSLAVTKNTGVTPSGSTQSAPLYSEEVGTTLSGYGSYSKTTLTGSYTSTWNLPGGPAGNQMWAEIGAEFIPAGTIAPTDSLSISDSLFVHRVVTRSFNESLPVSDSIGTIKSVSKSLSDSLQTTDSVSSSKTYKLAMLESLSLSGSMATNLGHTSSLTEQLNFTSSSVPTHQALRLLSDSLNFTTSSAQTASFARSLSDSLNFTSSSVPSHQATQNLSDSLNFTSSSVPTHQALRLLSDSLNFTSSSVPSHQATQNLSDSLNFTTSSAQTPNYVKSLSDQVALSDSISAAHYYIQPLSDSLNFTASLAPSHQAIQALSDQLNLTSLASPSHLVSASLTESLPMSDGISFEGGIKIEARDQNNNLVPGATYTVSPNPTGSSVPETVIDGGLNDNDGKNDGRAVVISVPLGSYNITMSTIPSGYNVLGNSTIYTVHSTNLDGTSVFRLIPVNTTLATLPPTVITSAPNLNSTTLGTWTSSFNAVLINDSTSSPITKVQSLPPIISVGNNNPSLGTAISNQGTVQLNTSFPSNASSSYIMTSLGVPTYSMPRSSNVTAVIPSIVASTGSGSPTQLVTTPPLDTIVPGQPMVMPVEQQVIPSTGGLKQLDLQPASNSSSVGTPANDWFVIHVTNQLPSALPVLPASDKLTLYVNVTYQYEENHIGFNWGNPSNFAAPPKLTLQLPKNPSGLKVDSNGCPESDIFVYDPSTSSWTTNPVKIISASPTAGNSNTCDVVVQTAHFSQFALGGHGSTSGGGTGGGTGGTGSGTGTSSGGGFSGGGGSGSTGAGPGTGGSGGGGSGGGFGGILLPELKIYQVSYDVCDKNTATMVVGTDSSQVPTVIIRSSITGVISAQLAQDQPYLTENENATVKKYVYDVALNPQEKSFEVVAMLAQDNNVETVGRTVNVATCKATLTFEPFGQGASEQPTDIGAPRILDLMASAGNGTAVHASEYSGQYVDGQDLSVSSIISSPTPVTTAELRYVQEGQDQSKYSYVTMNAAPIQISNTTYMLSGTIPSQMMLAPAVSYWVHVENQAGSAADSQSGVIGVKPVLPVSGSLELDVAQYGAAGGMQAPTAYFTNNSTGPVFGTVSLLADGSVVYTSPPQLFNSSVQTPVSMPWRAPPNYQVASHNLEAQADFYGTNFTAEAAITTFSAVKTVPIAQPEDIQPITSSNNHTVANPKILYSSYGNDGTTSYQVTAPDGTCVIGQSAGCLVSGSTFGDPGQLKSIVVGSQALLVRYSGPNDPVERFSITSSDPIVGRWNVQIVSSQGLLPEAAAMKDVTLKVTYRPSESPLANPY